MANTAICNVIYGSNYIEIMSPTGKVMKIEVGCDEGNGWTWFDASEQNFLRHLMHQEGDDSDTELTFEEMRRFKLLCEKYNACKEQAEREVEEEAALCPNIDARLRKQFALIRRLKSTSEDKAPLFRVVYYVPSRVSSPVEHGGHGMFANLAGRMRGAGLVQFDGSTYYGKEVCKPSDVFSEIDEWNKRPEVAATEYLPKNRRLLVKYRWEEIHPAEMERTRNEAFANLRDHVVEVHMSLLESIDNAGKRMDETIAKLEQEQGGVTNKQQEAAHKRRISNVGAALSVARKSLENALKAAQVFDETESLEPLFEGVREAIKSSNAALVALKRAR